MTYTDKWIQSSSLQKSIRRGNTQAAYSAADWFLANGESAYLLRRLEVIAIEDIGIGGVDVVLGYLASATADRKKRLYDIVQELSDAPKDRNACNFSLVAEYGLGLSKEREQYPHLPDTSLVAVMMDPTASFYARTLAAWVLCGTRLYPSLQFRSYRESFTLYMHCLSHMGIPEDVRLVIELATRKRVDSMTVALPFVYLLSRQSKQTVITHEPVNNIMLGDTLAVSMDMHTRIGKACIYELTFNSPIFALLSGKVPNALMSKYTGWALFEVEGGEVSKQLSYQGCNEPARDSTAAVLVNERFTKADVQSLVDLVRLQLPQLNAIRTRKLKQLDTAPQQLTLPQ